MSISSVGVRIANFDATCDESYPQGNGICAMHNVCLNVLRMQGWKSLNNAVNATQGDRSGSLEPLVPRVTQRRWRT